MKKIVTLLTVVLFCLGMSMTVFAAEVKEDEMVSAPSANGADVVNNYAIKDAATNLERDQIATAALVAVREQLAIPATATVDLIAAGDYKLYDKNGVLIPNGVVPTGNEKFYFGIPASENTTGYYHGAPIYVTHEYSPGKWEIIMGQIVQTANGWKMEVTMNDFSPVAFFKIMSDGDFIVVTKKGSSTPTTPGVDRSPGSVPDVDRSPDSVPGVDSISYTYGWTPEEDYFVTDNATQSARSKIKQAAEAALKEQIALPASADLKVVAAGDYRLYDKNYEEILTGIVPTGSRKFYFNIPDGNAAEYVENAPIYVTHEYAAGKWEIIQGKVVQVKDGRKCIEVYMKNFSPIAFFKIMSNGRIIGATYKDGSATPEKPTLAIAKPSESKIKVDTSKISISSIEDVCKKNKIDPSKIPAGEKFEVTSKVALPENKTKLQEKIKVEDGKQTVKMLQVYEIDMTLAGYPIGEGFGTMTVDLPVGTEYEGKSVQVYQLHNKDGEDKLILHPVKVVKNGVVTIDITQLSTFGVALASETTTQGGGQGTGQGPVANATGRSPKTGDLSNILMWVVLLILAGGVVSFTTIRRKHK